MATSRSTDAESDRHRCHGGQRGRRPVALPARDRAAEAAPAAPTVYGDAAYGTGPVPATLEVAGAVSRPVLPASGVGHYTKDDFMVDLGARTVLPGGPGRAVPGIAHSYADFGRACATCPLAGRCTTSPDGRKIEISPHEALLSAGRASSRDPAWLADYRATRPKVERKLAHLVRRKHGGRRARVRGRQKVGADFSLLAAAVNLARLAVLGVTRSDGTWAVRPA